MPAPFDDGVVGAVRRAIRNDRAVYWPPISDDVDRNDEDSGKVVWDSPYEICCYWDDAADAKVSKGGQEIVLRTQVIVGNELKKGGYLWHGRIDQCPQEFLDDPTVYLPGYDPPYQIIHWSRTASASGRKIAREAFL